MSRTLAVLEGSCPFIVFYLASLSALEATTGRSALSAAADRFSALGSRFSVLCSRFSALFSNHQSLENHNFSSFFRYTLQTAVMKQLFMCLLFISFVLHSAAQDKARLFEDYTKCYTGFLSAKGDTDRKSTR